MTDSNPCPECGGGLAYPADENIVQCANPQCHYEDFHPKKECPECMSDMQYIGRPKKPHETDYWECDHCGHEESVR